jgi:hypothetical protein
VIRIIVLVILLSLGFQVNTYASPEPTGKVCVDWLQGGRLENDGTRAATVQIKQQMPDGIESHFSVQVLNQKAAEKYIPASLLAKITEVHNYAKAHSTKRSACLAVQTQQSTYGFSAIHEIADDDDSTSYAASFPSYNAMIAEAHSDLQSKTTEDFNRVILIVGDERIESEVVNSWGLHALRAIGSHFWPGEYPLPIQAFKQTENQVAGSSEPIVFFWKH